MNKIILPAVLAALAITAAAPAFANEDKVFDHSSVYVTQDIAAQGFNVVNVEEWGEYVVATVVDAEGHSSFKYFDPDTLTLVR
ncbi:hypothetical protein NIM87_16325 [Devosia sp. XJ19-1]|uniref:PepSY domain-containing protein n=1 Tax=Devosia ureilytica TaxID=2952754 RepID=A0A9Q4AQY0_9HYPH|nr:hypothetical protein [Devosia ureilytica]MCP8885076.1 hypothetical protein [Devosia ureilytica]MCP8888799.1 hypothetical protein [Devosia ureilytica]